MARKATPADKALRYKLTTKVNEQTYSKLRRLLGQNPGNDMSNLIRTILTGGPIRIFTRDETFDNLLHELTQIRTEIRRIGVNINQLTKQFNSYPEPQRKALYAKVAFDQYLIIQPKIDRLLEITGQLAQKWLSA